MRDGSGTLWSANNSKFVGTFKNDKKHGSGQIFFPEGTIYQEKWNNNILESHIKIYDPKAQEVDPLKKQSDLMSYEQDGDVVYNSPPSKQRTKSSNLYQKMMLK